MGSGRRGLLSEAIGFFLPLLLVSGVVQIAIAEEGIIRRHESTGAAQTTTLPYIPWQDREAQEEPQAAAQTQNAKSYIPGQDWEDQDLKAQQEDDKDDEEEDEQHGSAAAGAEVENRGDKADEKEDDEGETDEGEQEDASGADAPRSADESDKSEHEGGGETDEGKQEASFLEMEAGIQADAFAEMGSGIAEEEDSRLKQVLMAQGPPQGRAHDISARSTQDSTDIGIDGESLLSLMDIHLGIIDPPLRANDASFSVSKDGTTSFYSLR